MWSYEKKLQYPVKIKNTNPAMAQIIMSQLGGPDGETGAALRYLNQRYSCPYNEITGVLTDVGSEASVLHQEENGTAKTFSQRYFHPYRGLGHKVVSVWHLLVDGKRHFRRYSLQKRNASFAVEPTKNARVYTVVVLLGATGKGI